MGRIAKTYICGVIGTGCLLLAWSVVKWPPVYYWPWALFMALAVVASTVKLRLPGMDGTYSLSFLFLLYGVAHFSLAETLIASCMGAVAQCLLNKKKTVKPIQAIFSAANLVISVGVCFFIARIWLTQGLVHHLPAVMALVACVYFVVNTVIVSGILAIAHNKRMGDVCREWYVWAFPYYLAGVVLVGLLPAPGYSVPGEAWLALLPMVYLVHFFVGLGGRRASSPAIGEQPNTALPRTAQLFVCAVAIGCVIVLALAAAGWRPADEFRFVVYLVLAVTASTFKIRFPRMRGSIAPSFVLALAAIAQLSFSETAFMAVVVGLVQVLWRPSRRPMAAQVVFNPACLTLSAALAWYVSRVALDPWLGNSITGVLAVGTVVLYGSNTLMVAMVMAMVDRKSLSSVWQTCYFWSLPYYLVGASAAGLMTGISRVAGWQSSLLVLPLMALVYFSYQAHLSRASVDEVTTALAA